MSSIEFASLFSNLRRLSEMIRELYESRGISENTATISDKLSRVASSIFGVAISDPNQIAAYASSWIREWTNFIDAPTRQNELANSMAWYSGAIKLQDEWVDLNVYSRVHINARVDALMRMYLHSSQPATDLDYFDVLNAYFAPATVRSTVHPKYIRPSDLITMTPTAAAWRSQIENDAALTAAIVYGNEEDLYILFPVNATATSYTVNLPAIFNETSGIDVRIESVGSVDGMPIKKCVVMSTKYENNSSIDVSFHLAAVSVAKVGSNASYTFQMSSSITVTFGNANKPTADTNIALKLRGKFLLSTRGLSHLLRLKDITTNNYIGGFSPRLGAILTSRLFVIDDAIIDTIYGAVRRMLSHLIINMISKTLTFTFPLTMWDFQTFVRNVMTKTDPALNDISVRHFILTAYVMLVMLYSTPYMLLPFECR